MDEEIKRNIQQEILKQVEKFSTRLQNLEDQIEMLPDEMDEDFKRNIRQEIDKQVQNLSTRLQNLEDQYEEMYEEISGLEDDLHNLDQRVDDLNPWPPKAEPLHEKHDEIFEIDLEPVAEAKPLHAKHDDKFEIDPEPNAEQLNADDQ